MQLRELENQVFSHRVVTENGFEKIVATGDLDPNVQSRVRTLLEAQVIVNALVDLKGPKTNHPVVQMFEPVEMAKPAETPAVVDTSTSQDPSRAAYDAAISTIEYVSTRATAEQFALGA